MQQTEHDRRAANDARRRDRRELELVLKAHGVKMIDRACRCPFKGNHSHDDKNPSAGIYQAKDGAWKFSCRAGSCGEHGDVFDLISKLEHRPLDEVLRGTPAPARPVAAPVQADPMERAAANEKKTQRVYKSPEAMVAGAVNAANYQRKQKGEPENVTAEHVRETNAYTNPETGRVDLVTYRVEPPGGGKLFMQGSPTEGGYHLKKPDGLQPIFNRHRVKAADTVIVVEGEKCVLALAAVNVVATTAPGGSAPKIATDTDWRPLAGKRCYLWPDWDRPVEGGEHAGERGGVEHMKRVAVELKSIGCEVYTIDPSGLELDAGGDAADWIDQNPGADYPALLRGILDAAKPDSPSQPLYDLIEDTISGKRIAIRFPWHYVSTLTNALLPGTVTVVCGEVNAAKSWLLLAAYIHWLDNGAAPAYLALEVTRQFYLNRIQALIEMDFNVLEPDWIRDNADTARAAYSHSKERLDAAGANLELHTQEYAHRDALEWIAKQCGLGRRILIIDPVTKLVGGDPWTEDLIFISKAQSMCAKHGASLIVVTHPRKSSKSGSRSRMPTSNLDDLAGGSAWSRHTDTVLWIVKHKIKLSSVHALVAGTVIEKQVKHNRTLRIIKTWHGKGDGSDLALNFGISAAGSATGSPWILEEGLIINEPGDGGAALPAATEEIPP